MADKNSGIWAGKFLERMQHKNPETGVFYNQSAFQLGEVIRLNVFNFQLLRADEFTWNYMSERPAVFPSSHCGYALEKLKRESQSHKSYDDFLVALMKAINPKNEASVDYNTLTAGLK